MNLTDEQIAALNQHPKVKHAGNDRISFTYEFRVELYEEWEKNPSTATIRRVLQENGFNTDSLGERTIETLNRCFKRDGYPSRGKNRVFGKSAATFRTTPEGNERLLATGKFVKSRKGICFAPDFVNELYYHYPEQSVEDGLTAAGLDPEEVGYQRIHHLQSLFDGCEDDHTSSIINERKAYPAELREQMKTNPFIKKITMKTISFNDIFFEAMSSVRELHIDDILDICGIDPTVLSISTRNRLRYRLLSWEPAGGTCFPEGPDDFMLTFYKKLSERLSVMVDEGFLRIKEKMPAPGETARKNFMKAVDDLCTDVSGYCSKTKILKRLGISRNCFYSILQNDDYGTASIRKKEQDKKDAEAVRTVMEYKGIKKGSRQIYMQMQDLMGMHLSVKKIRRLMKEYGMDPGIRKKTMSRKASAEMVKKQKKPNLVKRKFRLHRPGELTLTDVTYLKHGNGKTSYASALLDPVTGRLLCFNVSGSNDLALVMESLEHIDPLSVPPGAVFHSDQGMLYMNETFQRKVSELGYIQSMSRRGNCWDNSPQESFFGHFKSECSYRHLETVGELAKELEKYADYWNNDRKQWTRKRMTPVRYEEYMNSMTDEEYAAYLAAGEEAYRKKKERAVEKAKERAACLGAVEG